MIRMTFQRLRSVSVEDNPEKVMENPREGLKDENRRMSQKSYVVPLLLTYYM